MKILEYYYNIHMKLLCVIHLIPTIYVNWPPFLLQMLMLINCRWIFWTLLLDIVTVEPFIASCIPWVNINFCTVLTPYDYIAFLRNALVVIDFNLTIASVGSVNWGIIEEVAIIITNVGNVNWSKSP